MNQAMIKQAKSLAAMIKDKETAKAEESHDQAKWNLIFDLVLNLNSLNKSEGQDLRSHIGNDMGAERSTGP